MRETPVVTLHCDPDGVIETQGLGYHSRTFDGLVADVRKLLGKEELRQTMGRKARSHALEHHSIERIAEQLDELLRSLARRG
jgi:glycosyltransferase involved in cell wall biosynthesis